MANKEGKIYKYGDMEMQAVDGTIRVVNKSETWKDKPEQRVSLADWARRVLTLNLCCQHYASKDPFLTTAEKDIYKEYDKLYDIAMAVGREAKQQGNPLDPKVAADKLDEFKNSMKHNIIIP